MEHVLFLTFLVVPITVFPLMLHICIHHKAILTKKKKTGNPEPSKKFSFWFRKFFERIVFEDFFFSVLIIARNFKTVNNKIQLFECIVCKSNLLPTFLISTCLLSPNIATRFGLTISHGMLNVRHKTDNDQHHIEILPLRFCNVLFFSRERLMKGCCIHYHMKSWLITYGFVLEQAHDLLIDNGCTFEQSTNEL